MCSMLDCPWRNRMSKTHLSWGVAYSGACCLVGSAQVTDYILESSLHSAVQDLKAVLGQSRTLKYGHTVSFNPWQNFLNFPCCTTCFCFLVPKTLSHHACLSVLQCSLGLFIWVFEEFSYFHSLFFSSPKLARYWLILLQFLWKTRETERKQVSSPFCSMSSKIFLPFFFFFFECTPLVSTVYIILDVAHVSYYHFFLNESTLRRMFHFCIEKMEQLN